MFLCCFKALRFKEEDVELLISRNGYVNLMPLFIRRVFLL